MIRWLLTLWRQRKERKRREAEGLAWRRLCYRASLLRRSPGWEAEDFHYGCGDR